MVATQVRLGEKGLFAGARFVDHPSFRDKDAAVLYCDRAASSRDGTTSAGHLSDDITRDLAKRMHYAAYRLSGARNRSDARNWRERYHDLRDQIILGNRKLIYRAVQMRVRDPQFAEDCAADCHLVMIRLVTCYNPWLGIRFSTYAFTCLLRACSRLLQKQSKDRLSHAASFTDFSDDDVPGIETILADTDSPEANVARFLAAGHTLLTDREKQVLSQRFGFNAKGARATLQDIGSELLISKERVRQLQDSALKKLRKVLAARRVGV